ncbi:hypothetical protein BPTFM16_01799 [Altererythrobacter insulae]|nr:hypothetical protein BPTFM16_01799 [Altererythrobacter insulae]
MIRWLSIIIALVVATPAWADEIRPSSIEFAEQGSGQWTLDWKQPVSTLNGTDLLVPGLPANCAISDEPAVRTVSLAFVGHAKVACDGEVTGGSISLPLLGGADALLRVVPLDQPVQTYRLTASDPTATIAAQASTLQVFWTYLIIGAEHILFGWDHLLFVIALVLLVQKGWAVVKAATAFTIAHSITLVASTLGFAGLPQGPVEALIALSIVFLAVELTKTDRQTWTQRWPWIVAFAFGLLHGFGFAGALREIGLPEGEVPAALLAFNLGVEAGQLLVVALVIGARAAIQRLQPNAEAPALKMTTYAIGITASYWLVDRVIA